MLIFLWQSDPGILPGLPPSNPWQDWYDSQNEAVRGRHDTVIRFLEAGNWSEPWIKELHGFNDLHEIRITKGVAHRLLGFRNFRGYLYAVVLPCVHKEERYYPNDALATAERMVQDVKKGDLRVIPCMQPVKHVKPRRKKHKKRRRRP